MQARMQYIIGCGVRMGRDIVNICVLRDIAENHRIKRNIDGR